MKKKIAEFLVFMVIIFFMMGIESIVNIIFVNLGI